MLSNLILVSNLSKIPHSIRNLSVNCGLTRKFTQQIWEQQMNEIIKRKARIYLIEHENTWEKVSSILYSDVKVVNAVGFDCEWSQVDCKRKPIALLQLATYTGNCFLFRLNSLQNNLPSLLQELLENREILKVGVAADLDASNFTEDYNVNVNGWLDLRHLALLDDLKNRKLGLKSLAKHYLEETLTKDWKVRASDWELPSLTEQQVGYAAEDAIVGLHILFAQLRNLWKPVLEESWEVSSRKAIEEVCKPYVEVKFNQNKNFCFVCGESKISARKNVCPKEYSKYFSPLVQVNIERHLILLCGDCNESNIVKNVDLKLILAEECDAPIGKEAYIDERIQKMIEAQNAARNLKSMGDYLPQEEVNVLKDVLKNYYETDEFTEDLLNKATDISKDIKKERCNLHGYKVFKYYEKIGLINLLTRWRKWFLDSMKPKYLPEYWHMSDDFYLSELRKKMSRCHLDSDAHSLYKIVLVGTEGNLDDLPQFNTQMNDVASSSSPDSNKEISKGKELCL